MPRGRPKKSSGPAATSAATVGYEAQLWQMADALRGSMDAAEYKHVALGLLFLKYISDAFEERHALLEAEQAQGADPEDPDEYLAHNVFWVPQEARWAHLKAQAKQPTVGQIVDGAMAAIERDNPSLKGVLPKDYARPALDKTRLGQLIDLITNIRVGDAEARSKDVLGRVYEYFLSQFASAEGKKGGERLKDDKRWQYGVPPAGNANFAWVQHIVHHLATTGVAGFVLANGSMSSGQSGEGEIRKSLVGACLVDCMVALPGQLFYSTQIPACLWFLASDLGFDRSGAAGAVIAPKSKHWLGFVLGHVTSSTFVDYTNAGATGTRMPRTSWHDMTRYDLVLPPVPLAAEFSQFVRPSIERIIASIHESRTLAALRDTLLPKLISGELRVKDGERFVAEVA